MVTFRKLRSLTRRLGFRSADRRRSNGITRIRGRRDIGAKAQSLEDRLLLAIFSVTNVNDAGAGSLRQAVLDANASAGLDTISISAGLSGQKLMLTSGALTVTDEVRINGPGADKFSINGNALSRIFVVDAPDGESVEINRLAITNGLATGSGGAIEVLGGNLLLDRLYIHGNSATVAGGGIHVNDAKSVVTVLYTTIAANNGSDNGGGIYNAAGKLYVINSTLSENTTNGFGGGLLNNTGMTAVLRNATVAFNRADLDSNSTGLGGGLAGPGLALFNTLVVGNYLGPTATRNDINATLTAGSSHNLVSHAGSAGGLTNGVNGNIVNAVPSSVLVDILTTGFGGATPIYALAENSPALDAGSNAEAVDDGSKPLDQDQRFGSFARIFDGDGEGNATVDIGAFEAAPLTFTVDLAADEQDGNYAPGDLSLREALALTQQHGFDTVTFSKSLHGKAINLSEGQGHLTINSGVTIAGPGADLLAIDGGSKIRIFLVSAGLGDLVTIRGLTLRNGNATSFAGGAINHANGDLLLDGLVVENNQALAGGAVEVFAPGRRVTIANSAFSGNHAEAFGGGLNVTNATELVIFNSTFSGNTADEDGGAINATNTVPVFLRNVTVTGNRADADGNNSGTGGGVYAGLFHIAIPVKFDLHNSIVAGNFRGAGTIADDIAEPVTVGSSYNLIGDAASAGGLVDGKNGNIVGVDGVGTRAADTILNTTLTDNGGPTPTHALAVDSPAIDAGSLVRALDADGAPLTVDQRNSRRVFDGDGDGRPRIDIGAVEAGPAAVNGTLIFDPTTRRWRLGHVDGGTLTWSQTNALPANTNGWKGFVGDFNGDGLLDGMALNLDTMRLNFFANAGNGTLSGPASAGSFSTNSTWGHFMVGDYNGDGRAEVMAQVLSGPSGVGSLYSKDSSGVARFYVRLSPDYETFVTGDFNGDHVDDVLGLFDTPSLTRSNIIPVISIDTPVGRRMTAVLGAGQFGAGVVNGGLHNLIAADLNGDGRDDLAVLNANGQTFIATTTGVPRNNAPDVRNFVVTAFAPLFSPTTYVNPILTGNFTHDVRTDLFSIRNNDQLVVGLSNINANPADAVPDGLLHITTSIFGNSTVGEQAVIGDFSGDGLDDLIVLGTTASQYDSTGSAFTLGFDFGNVLGGAIGTLGSLGTARTGRVI